MSGLPHVSSGSVLERRLISLGEGVAGHVIEMKDCSVNGYSVGR